VSVGGLLGKHFGNNIHKNTKYRRSAQKKRKDLGVCSWGTTMSIVHREKNKAKRGIKQRNKEEDKVGEERGRKGRMTT
jgi:hypothetical protein